LLLEDDVVLFSHRNFEGAHNRFLRKKISDRRFETG